MVDAGGGFVAAGDDGVSSFVDVGRRGRKRRRAVYVSEVDRALLERGLEPSWEQRVSASDFVDGASGVQSNDQRLVEDVPPHSHSRL